MNVKVELIRIVKEEIGPTPTVEAVVDVLEKNRVLSERNMKPFVIWSVFWHLYKKSGRSARDIEEEIAAQFEDMTRDAVKDTRRYFHRKSRKKAE